MGHTVGLELKAQMGLDIPLSYISPPLDSCPTLRDESRTPRGNNYSRSSTGRYWTIKELINAPSKGVLHLIVGSAIIIV